MRQAAREGLCIEVYRALSGAPFSRQGRGRMMNNLCKKRGGRDSVGAVLGTPSEHHRFLPLLMKDEEHARTAKLRRLMRDFNRWRDDTHAFALELELTVNSYGLYYPILDIRENGITVQAAMACKEEGRVTVPVYTSMQEIPEFCRAFPLGHADMEALWATLRTHRSSALAVDSFSLHATTIVWRKDKLTFLPMRDAALGKRKVLKAAKALVAAWKAQSTL